MNNIEQIKAARTQEKQTIDALKRTVVRMAEVASLDSVAIARRIQVATKSEYGRVNGMVNLVAAIAKWPAEQGDGASIASNQALLESELNLDLLLLEDISAFKGYHTFHTDELDIIDGIEPDYNNYRDYSTIFLESVGTGMTSAEISTATWKRNEVKAKKRAKAQIAELRTAVAEHKALIA